ncbi:hypothetical protein ACWDMY_25185 [Streptomyces globisporus]|uniref:hypothetical protein n=1 Tax=Streptomyces TaxID=1883 RepID=UPI00116126EE|nr:hypothetical protein [Streptomyces sp. TSRI0445]
MFFEQHPLDLDIVEFFDRRNEVASHSVGDHIQSCKVCAIRLRRVAQNSNTQQGEGDSVVVKSLGGVASEEKGSHPLASFVNAGRVVDPQPGQVWRLHWEDVTHLALIASTACGNLTIWPVTLDVLLADESSLLVPASESGGLDLELAVWPAIETGIGAYVLERYVTDILPPERLRELRRAYRSGDELPAQWLPGVAVDGPESSRGRFRTDLIQVAAFLGEASWEPEDWVVPDSSETSSLAEVLSMAGISATRLVEELDFLPRRAISLRRGMAEPTPQELDLVHQAFGLSATGNRAAPPREVIEALDDPRARDLIIRVAAIEGTDEASLRRDLAQSHFALAARKTGSSGNVAFEMLATELQKRIAAGRKFDS